MKFALFRSLPLAAGLLLASHAFGQAKPSGAQLLQMDDGRSGKGNLIATTGVRSMSGSRANAHALIMTIGDYPAPIPKLRGVDKDAATATEMAARMGIPAERIRYLRDAQLSLDGMEKALDDLEAKLAGDDRVFIYFSGHGGRQVMKDDKGEERCAESLITHDTIGMADEELEARLKRIAAKSQKTIVMIDACHSGGVTTRTSSTGEAAYVAKSYPGGQSCSKPSNVLTRSLAQPKPAGSGGANFVHIAAARDSEIALDQPGRGGVASQAILACMTGASDRDGSGGLNSEEVRLCAQEKINQQLTNAPGVRPHNITLTGNTQMVLSLAAKDGSSASTATATGAASVKPSALAALNDLYNSRDDRYLVTTNVPRPQLRIGKDHLDFTVSSREGGFVYVLMAGSDGRSFDLLFPNQLDRNNVLEPGGSMRLPRAAWRISAEGPPGRNTLLILVSDAPRDFSAAGLVPSGPFSAASALAAKDIQLVTASASNVVAENECGDSPQTRALAVRKRCSSSYGAALITIDEVQ